MATGERLRKFSAKDAANAFAQNISFAHIARAQKTSMFSHGLAVALFFC